MISHFPQNARGISHNLDRVKENLILWLKRKSKFGNLAPRIKIPHKTKVALGLSTRWTILREGTLCEESGQPIITFPNR